MATLVDTTAALDLNKDDDAAELKRQRLRDKKRRQRQKQRRRRRLTERRDTENKGQGLFATQSMEEGAVVARQPPALSLPSDAQDPRRSAAFVSSPILPTRRLLN